MFMTLALLLIDFSGVLNTAALSFSNSRTGQITTGRKAIHYMSILTFPFILYWLLIDAIHPVVARPRPHFTGQVPLRVRAFKKSRKRSTGNKAFDCLPFLAVDLKPCIYKKNLNTNI